VSSLGWKAGQLGVIGGFSDRHVFTAAVGSYPANGYGLHDLGGNVWEWCEDWHPDHRGKFRVLRGGSWLDDARDFLASSYRSNITPDYRGNFNGFRVVVVR
jgi:formylglycine-generating enzyme required for sulfatase activity